MGGVADELSPLLLRKLAVAAEGNSGQGRTKERNARRLRHFGADSEISAIDPVTYRILGCTDKAIGRQALGVCEEIRQRIRTRSSHPRTSPLNRQ